METTYGAAGGMGERRTAHGHYAKKVNVGDRERLASVLAGAALAAYGGSRRSLGGILLALVGGGLAYRGLSGHCHLYNALGIETLPAGATVRGNLGIKIDRSIDVNAPPVKVYAFWRRFENLPRIMSNVESVQPLGDTRSHWTVRAPGGTTLEWDAEIINDRPDRLIAWKSVPGSAVDHAGSVTFEPIEEGRATRLQVSLQYDPPGGEIGHALASLFDADAGARVEEDLRNFKQAFEAGHVAA
jgi:uncharacterized membrane protein